MERQERIDEACEAIKFEIRNYEKCMKMNAEKGQHLLASAYAEFASTLRTILCGLWDQPTESSSGK